MFLLKKILSPFLFPTPLILIILAVGLVRLWRHHRQAAPKGRMWFTGGFLMLTLLATRPLPTFLLGNLEGQYGSFQIEHTNAQIESIVVLGGGASDDPDLDALQRLSEASLIRLTEGIRLARAYPKARLILSGGAAFGSIPEASTMAAAAEELGFDTTRILLESLSFDTDDQARAMVSMTEGKPFVLVTSASHMPRAMQLFRYRGLDPFPAPTNRLVKHPSELSPGAYFPSSINLEHSRILFRETLGRLWAAIVNKVR